MRSHAAFPVVVFRFMKVPGGGGGAPALDHMYSCLFLLPICGSRLLTYVGGSKTHKNSKLQPIASLCSVNRCPAHAVYVHSLCYIQYININIVYVKNVKKLEKHSGRAETASIYQNSSDN